MENICGVKMFGYEDIELWSGQPNTYPFDHKRGQMDILQRFWDKYGIPIQGYTAEYNLFTYNYMSGDEH